MAQDSWSARFTQAVASQIRLYRKQRSLSAQQLAQKCADLGLEISRSTIADLENGRRVALTVAELQVLAVALDVPPIELALPLGRVASTELLPGRMAPTWDAARWFRGDAELRQDATGSSSHLTFAERDGSLPIDLFKEHEFRVGYCRMMISWASQQAQLLLDLRTRRRQYSTDIGKRQATADATFQTSESITPDFIERGLQAAERDLQEARENMRKRGLVPPPLPPDLAHLDPGQTFPPDATR